MTQRLTQEDITDILQAFEQSGFARLNLTLGPIRLVVNRARNADARLVDLPPGNAQVVAPLLGMFQAGAEPDAPAIVQPGTTVQPDTTIGIIRVMNKHTAVKAGISGTVVEVLVKDGQFIEYGQALLRVSADSNRRNEE